MPSLEQFNIGPYIPFSENEAEEDFAYDTFLGIISKINSNFNTINTGGGSTESNPLINLITYNDVSVEASSTFSSGVDGWTGTNSTVSQISNPYRLNTIITSANSSIQKTFSAPIQGSRFTHVIISLKKISGGSSQQKLRYSTSGHGFSDSYYANPQNQITIGDGQEQILVFDMTSLSAGGTDWTANNITGLQFILDNGSSGEFNIEYVMTIGPDSKRPIVLTQEAIAAKDIAIAQAEAAELYKDEAEISKDLAEVFSQDSEAAKIAAQSAKTGAEGARDLATTAKNDAVTAKNAAETAMSQAEIYKDDAFLAKSSVEKSELRVQLESQGFSNLGFEDGILNSYGTPRGWLFSTTSANAFGWKNTVDSSSSYGSLKSYGAIASPSNGVTTGRFKIGKKIGVKDAQSANLTITAKILPKESYTIPSSISLGSNQTWMAESDVFVEMIAYDSSENLISLTDSQRFSKTLSQKLYDSGTTGFINTTTWRSFNHTFTIPSNAEYVEIWLTTSDGNNQVQALGYYSGETLILIDDVTFYCPQKIFELTESTVAAVDASKSALIYSNNANTSAISASNSATTAQTAATSAGNSSSAAATSATNASASETSALNSATAAQTAKVAAETARDNAAASSSAAATSATNAASSASNASSSAGISQSNALVAQAYSELSRYSDAEPNVTTTFQGSLNSWNTINSTLTLKTPSPGVTWVTTGSNPNLNRNGLSFLGSKYTHIIIRITRKSGSDNSDQSLFWATSGHVFSSSYYCLPDGGVKTLPIDTPVDLVYDLRTPDAGGNDWLNSTITDLRLDLCALTGNSFDIDYILLVGPDSSAPVKSALAASNSASSAAASESAAASSASAAQTSATNANTSAGQASTSASQASTSATNASNSASSASTSANNASTQAGNASSSAASAASSAATAVTASNEASSFSQVSARVSSSGLGLNINPLFNNWSGSFPENWFTNNGTTLWSKDTTNKINNLWSLRWSGNSSDTGSLTSNPLSENVNNDYYTIELIFRWNSGTTFHGSFIQLDFIDTSNSANNKNLYFTLEQECGPTPVNGQVYTIRKTFPRPTNFNPSGAVNINFSFLPNFNLFFNQPSASKDISVYKFNLYAASQSEISAFKQNLLGARGYLHKMGDFNHFNRMHNPPLPSGWYYWGEDWTTSNGQLVNPNINIIREKRTNNGYNENSLRLVTNNTTKDVGITTSGDWVVWNAQTGNNEKVGNNISGVKNLVIELELTWNSGSMEGGGLYIDMYGPAGSSIGEIFRLPFSALFEKQPENGKTYYIKKHLALKSNQTYSTPVIILMMNYSGFGTRTIKDITFHFINYKEATESESQVDILINNKDKANSGLLRNGNFDFYSLDKGSNSHDLPDGFYAFSSGTPINFQRKYPKDYGLNVIDNKFAIYANCQGSIYDGFFVSIGQSSTCFSNINGRYQSTTLENGFANGVYYTIEEDFAVLSGNISGIQTTFAKINNSNQFFDQTLANFSWSTYFGTSNLELNKKYSIRKTVKMSVISDFNRIDWRTLLNDGTRSTSTELLIFKKQIRPSTAEEIRTYEVGNEISAAVSVEASARAASDNSIQAKYSVKLDVNGYVSGFGLISEANQVNANLCSKSNAYGPGYASFNDVISPPSFGNSYYSLLLRNGNDIVTHFIPAGSLKQNTNYTLSFKIKQISGATPTTIYYDLHPDTLPGDYTVSVDNNIQYVSRTISTSHADILSNVHFRFFVPGGIGSGKVVEITEIKLEESSAPTPYSNFYVLADQFVVSRPGPNGNPVQVFSIGNVNGTNKLVLRGDMIADGTITANKIVAGTITADKLIVGSIDYTYLQDNTITNRASQYNSGNITIEAFIETNTWGDVAECTINKIDNRPTFLFASCDLVSFNGSANFNQSNIEYRILRNGVEIYKQSMSYSVTGYTGGEEGAPTPIYTLKTPSSPHLSTMKYPETRVIVDTGASGGSNTYKIQVRCAAGANYISNVTVKNRFIAAQEFRR